MALDEQPAWHPLVISSSTRTALLALRDAHLLDGFYLAGGTGLALQFGHRLSRDLDFFSREHFDERAFLQQLMTLDEFSLSAQAPHTLHATILKTKVSFLGYAYPVLFPMKALDGVAVADPRDIACMKLSAIASRGAKRDFMDLYFCAQRYGLQEILEIFGRKYARVHFNRVHILKSMTYFADAEKDPMPHMLDAVPWEPVKQYFAREVPLLL